MILKEDTMKNILLIIVIAFLTVTVGVWADETITEALPQPEAVVQAPAAAVNGNGLIMNFQDAPIGEVLNYLSQAASLIIMSDVFFDDVRINIVSKQPMSVDEIVSAINTILKEKSYAAVRVDRTLRVVKLQSAKYLNVPVSSGNEAAAIASGDHIITHIIPVRYADAVKLKDNLQPLAADYSVITANESSNSIIITDTASNVQKFINIVTSLDTQMSSLLDVRVYRLEFASAKDVADMLNRVFKKETTGNESSNRGGAGGGGGGGSPFDRIREMMSRGGNAENSTGSFSGNVQVRAAADESTNTVVVSGPTDTLIVIDNVIKNMDKDSDNNQVIHIYPLKNAQANNIKKLLNNMFKEMQNLNDRASGSSNNRRAAAGNASASSNSASLSDLVYIEADGDTNSVLVMTSPKNYEKIRLIIEELDMPVPQVLIKVLLVEVTTSDNLDYGAEFSVLNLRDRNGKTLGTSAGTDFDLASKTGGFKTTILENNLEMTIRALQEIGKLNVLSRPYILTSNNQKATITVGQEVPYVTDTRVTETGQTINTIRYQDIGIILSVTPTINPDGLVIMDIVPEISTITEATVKISDTFNASVYAKRSANSRVAILNGQTIVIGGLMQDQETDKVSKVPLLGDIPIIGELFKSTTKKKEKTELLIFLTPQVASGDLDLLGISENEKQNSREMSNTEKNTTLQEHIDAMESNYKEE